MTVKKSKTSTTTAETKARTKLKLKKTSSTNETQQLLDQCQEISETMVALRAWEIWNCQGCPEGRDLDNWLQAERELRESSSV